MDITLDDASGAALINVIGSGVSDVTQGPNSVEILLAPGVEKLRVDVTFPAPLTGTVYLVFNIEIPHTCEWEIQVVDSADDRWGNHPIYTYVGGVRRVHYNVLDMEELNGTGTPDFSDISEIRFVVRIPTSEQYGWPGDDDDRVFTISDLHLTDVSPDIAAAVAAGAATVTVNATDDQGPINDRIWKGLVAFEGVETGPGESLEVLRDVFKLNHARDSIIHINKWEENRDFFPALNDYDFNGVFAANYSLFVDAPEPWTFYPWLPCMPKFLWQDQTDPPVEWLDPIAQQRPKYAFSPPNSYPDLQEFIRDVVAAYRARGVASPGFSPLNEPNGNGFWGGTIPERHEWFRQAGLAIKAEDPDALVIGPSFGGRQQPVLLKALAEYLNVNGGPLDQVAVHGYTHGEPPAMFRWMAEGFRRILDEYPGVYDDTTIANNEWSYGLRANWFQQCRRPMAGAITASCWLAMLESGYQYALLFGINGSGPAGIFPGTGLYEADKITARPVLYALGLFNRLSGNRVGATTDQEAHGVETLATVDGAGVVRVLVWWTAQGISLETGTKSISLNLTLPSSQRYTLSRHLVDSAHSPREVGVGYVAPSSVSDAMVDGPSDIFNFDLELYGITLITLEPAGFADDGGEGGGDAGRPHRRILGPPQRQRLSRPPITRRVVRRPTISPAPRRGVRRRQAPRRSR